MLNRTEAENKAAASRTAALPGPRRIALRWTDFAGAIAGLWGAVALALLALDWRARRRLARVVRTSLPVRDPGVVEAFDRLRADMGVRRPVRLRTSNAVSSPCLIGWRSPAILLPPHVIAVLDRRQLRGILAHELSHVLHHDGLASSLQRGIEIVLALNPFVRWISNWIRESGEAECDRIGATVGARSSRAYVEALLVLEGYRSASLPRGPALALLGSGSLSARVRRLAERPVRAGRGRRTRLTGTLMLALATGLLVSVVIETTHRGEALGSWAVMSDDIDHRLAAPRSVAPEPPTTP